MRLLIAADLQIDGGRAYGTPDRPRLADQEEALDAIRVLADQRGVTDIVLAGDIFHERKPGPDALLVFRRFLERLDQDVHVCTGNHDLRGPGQPLALDLFDETLDVRVHDRPYVEGIRALDYLPDVALAMLPWSHPANLRAARDGASPVEHAAAVVAEAARLRATVEEFDSEALPVLVTHYALSGMRLPTGLATGELIGEPVLDTHALLAQGWRYVFAGHIHSTDRIDGGSASVDDEPGTAVSIGSPWTQDFGEADQPHGVWILDATADTLEHVEIPGRPFVTLTYPDITHLEEGAPDITGAVVRLRAALTADEVETFDVEGWKRRLYEAGAHKVTSITVDVDKPGRARAEGIAEDTDPLEALDAWIAANAIDPDEAHRLRATITQLLAQEAPDGH